MKDALASVLQTSLDLHFGRLAPLAPDPAQQPALAEAAAALVRSISEHLLKTADSSQIDTSIQQSIFNKDNALPDWIINKGLVLCKNDRCNLESAIRKLLKSEFNRRRFLDYLSNEAIQKYWTWSNKQEKKFWPLRRAYSVCENKYYTALNKYDFVITFDDKLINTSDKQDEVYQWYIKSIGTLTLIDLATHPIFEFTAKLLETKYKTAFILDVFKKLFKTAHNGSAMDRFGALILGDVPKAFALNDYQAALQAADPQAISRRSGVLELLRHMLSRFDEQCASIFPEARYRLGGDPPQSLVNHIGATYWLRQTLDAAKSLQQKKAVPTKGLRIEERTVLTSALEQKSILYFCLFDDPTDSAINPCHIRSVLQDSMVLQSPLGNKLNDALPGQPVHGYFSIAGTKQKSTYCDFHTSVLSVTAVDDNHALVELGIPATFELTRRSHKRLPLKPNQLVTFELSTPAADSQNQPSSNMEKWPPPLCIIPDGASHCQVRDLSAGGLMLEIHHDAPAYDYFNEFNKELPLLAMIHLAGHANIPDLKLGLRLEVKRIRDLLPLKKKYVGFQFTEAGEVRNDRLVRFSPVGKEGIFLINDWIFRNTIWW